jgi:PIN domain nuclease of toxin-antitoxin system
MRVLHDFFTQKTLVIYTKKIPVIDSLFFVAFWLCSKRDNCSEGECFNVIEQQRRHSGMEVPITAEIACAAVDLSEHHSDPQDRIIIATALMTNSQLISADRKFPLYAELTGKLVN